MNSKKKAHFITLEGVEGVGKSSNISYIKDYLENKGVRLQVTREPGGTPLAEEIRELFLSKRDEEVSENTELLLVFAARAQHLDNLIRPKLEEGLWVLSDRFTDATFAYQGYGRGLSIKSIESLEALVQKHLQPDLTFLLDMPVELGLERARARGEADRMESEQIEFFEKVRSGYLQRAKQYPQRFKIIDASQSLEDVQWQIKQVLDEAF